MPSNFRSRALIVAVFSASLGLSTFALVQAAPDPAARVEPRLKSVEVGRVFSYLDKYLSLAPSERGRFILKYTVSVNGRPLQGVKAWIQHGAFREEVPIGPGGRIERLPTLAEIRAKDRIVFDVPPTAKMGVNASPELAAKPAQEMSAADVAAAIDQTNAAIHRFAGLFGFAAPHISRAVFEGVGAGTGVSPEGKSSPLPADSHGPYYDPAKQKNLRTLKFANAPASVQLE